MINIIKTAIITITISFISGLLLDYYKNLAPRLLCNIGNGIPLKVNGEKIYAYIITIKNTSKKIIHQLNIDIQSSQDNLKVGDSKITKGLKFDSSVKNNSLDVYIPFLSKGDKFSVTLYVKNQYTARNQPVIAIRSPENFKKVDSSGQKGFLSSLVNIPENIGNLVSGTSRENKSAAPDKKRETFYRKNTGKTKKILISIVSIVLVVLIGILAKYYLSGTPDNTPTSNTTTSVPTQSKDKKDTTGSSSGQKTKTTDTNTSKYRKSDSTNTSNTGSNKENTSTEDSTSTSNTNTSIDGTNPKSSSGTNSSNTDTNADTKTSNSGTNSDKSTNSNTSTDGTNSNTHTSTDGTNSNTNPNGNTSTSGSSQNNNTSTGGKTSNNNK